MLELPIIAACSLALSVRAKSEAPELPPLASQMLPRPAGPCS